MNVDNVIHRKLKCIFIRLFKCKDILFLSKERLDNIFESLKNQFNIRVVNFGCWELFDMQPEDYKNNIIHDPSFKVSIEAGITQGWQKYTGNKALNIGINRFGESAPGKEVADFFDLNVNSIKQKIIKAYK